MSLPANPNEDPNKDRPTKYAPVPPDRKQTVILDALARVADGHRLIDIAQDHGITKQTLNTWLTGLGEEYKALRDAYIDSQIADAMESIDSANDAFALARAREQFKARSWYAERRDRQRYGVQQSQNSVSDLNVVINIGSHDVGTVVIDGTTNNPQE